MIKFKDLKVEAKKQGFTIEREDLVFSLLVLKGFDLGECAYLSGKYNERASTTVKARANKKKIDNRLASARMKGKKVLEETHIKWLITFIKPMFLEDTKAYVFDHLDDFDFIPKSSKQNLVDESLINKLLDTDEEETFDTIALKGIKKNIMAILRSDLSVDDKSQVETYLKAANVAIQRLLPQQNEQEISYFKDNFQEVYKKFNAVCPICSREIDVARGMICICPHCKSKIDLREEIDLK